MLRLLSWNIDSLNAALTSASPRAQLSRDVLDTIKKEDADVNQCSVCPPHDPTILP